MLFALLTESVSDSFIPGQSAKNDSQGEGNGFFQKLIEGLSGEGGLKKFVNDQQAADPKETALSKKSAKPAEENTIEVNEKKNEPVELKTTAAKVSQTLSSDIPETEEVDVQASVGNVLEEADSKEWENPDRLLKFAIQTKTRLLKAMDVEDDLQFQRLSSEQGPKTLKDIIQLADSRQLGLSSIKVVIGEAEGDLAQPESDIRSGSGAVATDGKQPLWMLGESIQLKMQGQENQQPVQTTLKQSPEMLQKSMMVSVDPAEADLMKSVAVDLAEDLETFQGVREKSVFKIPQSVLAVEQASPTVMEEISQPAILSKTATSAVAAKWMQGEVASGSTPAVLVVSEEAQEDLAGEMPSASQPIESKVRPFWYLRKDEMPSSQSTQTATQKSSPVASVSSLLQNAVVPEETDLTSKDTFKIRMATKMPEAVIEKSIQAETIRTDSQVKVESDKKLPTNSLRIDVANHIKRDEIKSELDQKAVEKTLSEPAVIKRSPPFLSPSSAKPSDTQESSDVELKTDEEAPEEKHTKIREINSEPLKKTQEKEPVSNPVTKSALNRDNTSNESKEAQAVQQEKAPMPSPSQTGSDVTESDAPDVSKKKVETVEKQSQTAKEVKNPKEVKSQENSAPSIKPEPQNAPVNSTLRSTMTIMERPVVQQVQRFSNTTTKISGNHSGKPTLSPLHQLLSGTQENVEIPQAQVMTQHLRDVIKTSENSKPGNVGFEKHKTLASASFKNRLASSSEEVTDDEAETLLRDRSVQEEIRMRQEVRNAQGVFPEKSTGMKSDTLIGTAEELEGGVSKIISGDETASVKETGAVDRTTSVRQAHNDLFHKVAESKETLRHFSMQLAEQVKEYKPPISRIRLELHPKELGSVEVTLSTRGTSLVMNLQSNPQALQLFMQNAQEFRHALGEAGFSDVQMNFGQSGGQNQSGEGGYQEGNENRLLSELEEEMVPENIEITLPRYI